MKDLFGFVPEPRVKGYPRPFKAKAAVPPATATERYRTTKHCCRICFGRVMKVADSAPLPIYRCADCGASGVGGPKSICSCGMTIGTGKKRRDLRVRCIKNPERSPVSPLIIVATEAAP